MRFASVMNSSQQVWWEQAKSDHDTFVVIRGLGVAQCDSLHYLQMATEKIAKAYFWRSGSPPPRSHAGFAQFLRFLGQTRSNVRERVARLFTFNRFTDFQNWIRTVLPIAYDLERLAPALANNGPVSRMPLAALAASVLANKLQLCYVANTVVWPRP